MPQQEMRFNESDQGYRNDPPVNRYEEPTSQYSHDGPAGTGEQELRGDLLSVGQRLALAIVSVVALVVVFVAGAGVAIVSNPHTSSVWLVAVITLIIIYSIFTGAVITINRLFSRTQ